MTLCIVVSTDEIQIEDDVPAELVDMTCGGALPLGRYDPEVQLDVNAFTEYFFAPDGLLFDWTLITKSIMEHLPGWDGRRIFCWFEERDE